jgi:hypothetical protein
MKRWLLWGLCLVVVVAQLTLLPALRPLGVVPAAVLGLVAVVGMEGTASEALVLAVTAGVVVDLGSGANFGLWTAVLVLTALAAGLLHRAGVELAGAITETVMVLVGTLIVNLVILVSLANSAGRWDWSVVMVHLVLQLVFNVAVMLALRPAVRWLMRQPGTGVVVGSGM